MLATARPVQPRSSDTLASLSYAVLAERDGVVPGNPVVIALVLEAP
jgi:hypothetical protein